MNGSGIRNALAVRRVEVPSFHPLFVAFERERRAEAQEVRVVEDRAPLNLPAFMLDRVRRPVASAGDPPRAAHAQRRHALQVNLLERDNPRLLTPLVALEERRPEAATAIAGDLERERAGPRHPPPRAIPVPPARALAACARRRPPRGAR